jgi:hypothetical protein
MHSSPAAIEAAIGLLERPMIAPGLGDTLETGPNQKDKPLK